MKKLFAVNSYDVDMPEEEYAVGIFAAETEAEAMKVAEPFCAPGCRIFEAWEVPASEMDFKGIAEYKPGSWRRYYVHWFNEQFDYVDIDCIMP